VDRSRVVVLLLLATLILLCQPLLAQQYIAGATFFTTKGGVRTNFFNPGDTVELRAEARSPVGPYTIEVYLAYPPETGRGEVFVGRQSSVTIHPAIIVAAYSLDPNAPYGRYSFHVRVFNTWGSLVQEGYVDFSVGSPAPSGGVTTPPPPTTPEWAYVALAGGIIGIAVLAAALILVRRPKPPAPMPTAPPPGGVGVGGTQAIPGGGMIGIPSAGTIQLTTPEGGTRVLTAMFQVGDKIVPISSLPQSFGREDFAGIAPPEVLNAISRRAKPQFTISFDYINRVFTIEDNNSTNGTLLNGENIKGKGPRPLKDGDIVSPAGVLNLKFVSRPAS
jgi:hypothetical protein